MTTPEEKTNDTFWTSIKEREGSPEKAQHADEVAKVPRMESGPLCWHKSDDKLCGEVPEPLDRTDSAARLEYIAKHCQFVRGQNPRARTWLYETANGRRLLQFDALAESDRKIVLDQRHAAVDDMAYRKERTALSHSQQQAVQTIATQRATMYRNMGITTDVELTAAEQDMFENLYSWLLYQTIFDSMKWVTVGRQYNGRAMLAECMARLFAECAFTSVVLDSHQITTWLSKRETFWVSLMAANVVFVMVRPDTRLLFWDLFFEHVRDTVSSKRSVVMVCETGAAATIPAELMADFRTVSLPRNKTLLDNLKVNSTSFSFGHVVEKAVQA